MDAATKLDTSGKESRPIIFKQALKNQDKLAGNRRSQDTEFFNDHLMKETLSSLTHYYSNFVNERAVTMNTTDEVRKMIETIEMEESRALYYIHSEVNRKQYVKMLNKSLIELKIEIRLRKADGFRKYVEMFEDKKDQYQKEIMDLWTVYSRVPEKSVSILKDIFAEYLLYEAEKVTDKTKKPPDFVEELIRINSKCIRIVEFCSNNFELENERNNKIRGMLSNDLTEKGRKQGKFDIGAKNLASYINHRFKMSYTKGGLENLG